MKSATLIDFSARLEQQNVELEAERSKEQSGSEDLCAAIRELIQQLRKPTP